MIYVPSVDHPFVTIYIYICYITIIYTGHYDDENFRSKEQIVLQVVHKESEEASAWMEYACNYGGRNR